MGLARDDAAVVVDAGRSALRDRIVEEVHRFLESVPEVDLATVYQTLSGQMGIHTVLHIAEAISTGLLRGEIEMEPRIVASGGQSVVYLRRAARRRSAA